MLPFPDGSTKMCLATNNKNSDSKHENIMVICCFIQQEALR